MSEPVAVGIVYIGESPRPSVEAEILPVLAGRVRLVPAGALDGLSRADIAALAPAEGEAMLFTRLSDDTPVRHPMAASPRSSFRRKISRSRAASRSGWAKRRPSPTASPSMAPRPRRSRCCAAATASASSSTPRAASTCRARSATGSAG